MTHLVSLTVGSGVRNFLSYVICSQPYLGLKMTGRGRREASSVLIEEAAMNVQSYKTVSARPAEVERSWYVVDGDQQVVGRLASRIASILRGKHKPSFTPHVDTGDYVIVINADKVRFTGSKETSKTYFSHSGYPGGVRVRSPKEMRTLKPEFIVENAVRGMLPKGPLGRQILKKLKVYAGPDHPHEAQTPTPLEI